MDEGPLYVVSGTTFRKFPTNKFQVYQDNVLHGEYVYKTNFSLLSAVKQNKSNFNSTNKGDLLRPMRNAVPEKVKTHLTDMRMPTGYFKVIYKPAMDNKPAQSIGFLLPHSFENLNLAADSYSNIKKSQAFWLFVSRIDLIEEVSGVRFPWLDHDTKATWGNDWFFEHDKLSKKLRPTSCGKRTPQGIFENSTREKRLKACTDMIPSLPL